MSEEKTIHPGLMRKFKKNLEKQKAKSQLKHKKGIPNPLNKPPPIPKSTSKASGKSSFWGKGGGASGGRATDISMFKGFRKPKTRK